MKIPKTIIVAMGLAFFFIIYSRAQNQDMTNSNPNIPLPTKAEVRKAKKEKASGENIRKRLRVSRDPLAEKSHWSFTGHDENLPSYRYFSKYINPYRGDFVERKGYRGEFVQRKTDKKPIVFYKHQRSIGFTLGHQNRMILINDSPATKSNQVVISDLEKKRNWQIDQKVIDHYYKNIFSKIKSTHDQKEVKFWTLPIGIGFSPDDHKVLIIMEESHFEMGGSPKEDARLREIYKNWSYVVNSENGNILKIYKTKDVPAEWWKF
jgi:hypothetical protein